MEPTGEMKEFIDFIEEDSGLDWHDAYNRFLEQRARVKFKSKGVLRELNALKKSKLGKTKNLCRISKRNGD